MPNAHQAHHSAPPPPSLLVIGQVSVDTVVHLASPLVAGDQAVGTFRRSIGGSGAIVAHNAAIVGAPVDFAGHVGGGDEDRRAIVELKASGVNVIATVATPTGLRVTCLVEPGGERTMVSNGECPDWAELDVSAVPGQMVYVEGWHLFEQPDSFAELIHRLAADGAEIALDVCSATRAADPVAHTALLRSLPLATVFANESEAAAYQLLQHPVAPLHVIHRGAASTLTLTASGLREYRATPVSAVDTTGAGDTFAAGFLAAQRAGADLSGSVDFAHRCAAESVLVEGALLRRTPVSQREDGEPNSSDAHPSYQEERYVRV